MRRATLAHIVFRMYLEKAEIGPLGEDPGIVLRLQAQSGARWQGVKGHGLPPLGKAGGS